MADKLLVFAAAEVVVAAVEAIVAVTEDAIAAAEVAIAAAEVATAAAAAAEQAPTAAAVADNTQAHPPNTNSINPTIRTILRRSQLIRSLLLLRRRHGQIQNRGRRIRRLNGGRPDIARVWWRCLVQSWRRGCNGTRLLPRGRNIHVT